MLGQLDWLLTLSALGNITIAVIPDNAKLRLIPGESFMILDDRAILETWVSEDTLHGDEAPDPLPASPSGRTLSA
jgi:hypothetical protein